MKNKLTTYALGISVLLVWGIIAYRVAAAVGRDDDTPNFSDPGMDRKEAYNDYAAAPDSTRLSLRYRDPFGLSPRKDTVPVTAKKPQAMEKALNLPKPPFDWNFVRYSGYIRTPGSKSALAAVSVNGRAATIGEGEEVNGLTLIKNLQDSIKVSFKGKTAFIKIQP